MAMGSDWGGRGEPCCAVRCATTRSLAFPLSPLHWPHSITRPLAPPPPPESPTGLNSGSDGDPEACPVDVLASRALPATVHTHSVAVGAGLVVFPSSITALDVFEASPAPQPGAGRASAWAGAGCSTAPTSSAAPQRSGHGDGRDFGARHGDYRQGERPVGPRAPSSASRTEDGSSTPQGRSQGAGAGATPASRAAAPPLARRPSGHSGAHPGIGARLDPPSGPQSPSPASAALATPWRSSPIPDDADGHSVASGESSQASRSLVSRSQVSREMASQTSAPSGHGPPDAVAAARMEADSGTRLGPRAGVAASAVSGDSSRAQRSQVPRAPPLYRLAGPLLRDMSCAMCPTTGVVATGDARGGVALWRPDGSLLAARRVFERRVLCAAISHDGRTCAFGSSDARLCVLAVPGGAHGGAEAAEGAGATEGAGAGLAVETLEMLSGHAGEVTCLALAHAGHVLASGGADGSVRMWARRGWLGVGGGWRVAFLVEPGPSPVLDVTVSGDGSVLVRGQGVVVSVSVVCAPFPLVCVRLVVLHAWTPPLLFSHPKPTQAPHHPSPPQAHLLLSGSVIVHRWKGGSFRLWSSTGWAMRGLLPSSMWQGAKAYELSIGSRSGTCLTVSSDGRMLVAAGSVFSTGHAAGTHADAGATGTAQVWDLETGEPLNLPDDTVRCVGGRMVHGRVGCMVLGARSTTHHHAPVLSSCPSPHRVRTDCAVLLISRYQQPPPPLSGVRRHGDGDAGGRGGRAAAVDGRGGGHGHPPGILRAVGAGAHPQAQRAGHGQGEGGVRVWRGGVGHCACDADALHGVTVTRFPPPPLLSTLSYCQPHSHCLSLHPSCSPLHPHHATPPQLQPSPPPPSASKCTRRARGCSSAATPCGARQPWRPRPPWS